jgi:endonuclease/exonuclease/phosphatase family metal-dependent hydrolase
MRLLDDGRFLAHLIHGYVGSAQVGSATLAVISRLSWKRAGTRYATRGIDDDGNVANFAESATLFTCDELTFSFLQVRGSVPLFWEQQGLQAFNARIQVTRSRLASQPAFDRHFVDLLQHYRHVHALNLLGQRDAEVVLTNAYAEHMRNTEAAELYVSNLSKEENAELAFTADLDHLGLTNFDFHSVARLNGGLDAVTSDLKRLGAVRAKRDAFRYTVVDDGGKIVERQAGVFRVNCLDCLDRTNVVQGILSQDALQLCITNRSMPDFGAALWSHHRTLWAENGDALSRIYAGTGALNSDFTRTGVGKKTLGGFLSDAAKSASRLYINNFQDKSKQNVIDALLGNMAEQRAVTVYDPVHDALNVELDERLDEYSTNKRVSVFTVTWNLAGRSPSGESLAPLLFPTDQEPDVYAIGLQEVVPLTPQQILLTDPEQLRYWERTINDTFSRRSSKQAQYVPLRSEQLVGTALLLYVKDSLLPYVRQVEATTKKTGLKGMSGNKGGVAIRMNVFDTSFCFVTAHFAAGQSNVEERNADYWTLSRSLAFRGGRNVSNSHHTVWLGDFNYRIEGGNEIVRPLCERNDLDDLAARDQLNRARRETQVFQGYTEGMLTFLPTYKYDFNSHSYDTGEKFRVPAWTDRILYASRHPFESQQVMYSRAELLTSDHRPVFALFESDVKQLDYDKRNTVRRELLLKYKSSQSAAVASGYRNPLENGARSRPDIDSIDGYDTDELPAPSSDDGPCWWDDPLSSEDESDALHYQNGVNGNPFARHRSGVQYAKRPIPNNGQQSSLSTSTSSKTFDLSPLSSVLTTPSSVPRSAESTQQTRRSAPPPPPPPASRASATSRQSPSTAEGKQTSLASTVTAVKSKTAPPPIPLKPVKLGEKQGEKTTNVTGDGRTRNPIPPPKVPARPTLGSRSQSFQSTKSQRSLLDDSD